MLVIKQSKGYHTMRDIPNLKRLWYCQQKYEKTTGCVCKKSGVCECQSILNVPIAEIDSLRSEKRQQRQKKRYSFWDLDFAQAESRLYRSRGIDMMRQMIVSRAMKEEMLRLAYGERRYPIFDQVILDESAYLRPLGQPIKIGREMYEWTSPPKEDYIEGRPKEPKPWQKLIPDNRKLKPR